MLPLEKEKVKFYKNKYIIAFYDVTDEVLLYIFDNVREILEFQNKEITKQNVNLINVELYNALQRKDNLCRFLNGEFMRVYIIDMENDF